MVTLVATDLADQGWCAEIMIVYLPINPADAPQLFSTDDLGALSVRLEADSVDGDAMSASLQTAAAGEVADGHVWLNISWLRTAAGETGQEWHDRFARMIDDAAGHGWLSDDGRRLRAHVDVGEP